MLSDDIIPSFPVLPNFEFVLLLYCTLPVFYVNKDLSRDM